LSISFIDIYLSDRILLNWYEKFISVLIQDENLQKVDLVINIKKPSLNISISELLNWRLDRIPRSSHFMRINSIFAD